MGQHCAWDAWTVLKCDFGVVGVALHAEQHYN